MKTIQLLKYYIILLSFTIFTTHANNQASNTDVYKLLDKSGLTKAIDSFPMQINAMVQQMSLTQKDPTDSEKFMSIMNASTNVDALQNTMFEYVKNNVSATDIKQILAWLDSDLASKIVKAELRSTDPAFTANLMRYIADLQQNPPSQARRLAINNYLKSTQAIEQTVEMIKSLIRNMFTAVRKLNPDNADISNDFEKQMSIVESQIAAGMRQQIVLSSYYIYENISDEELSLHGQFFHTELGKKYLAASFGAIGDAMNQWGENLMVNIAKEKQQK